MAKELVLVTGIGGEIGHGIIRCLKDLKSNLDLFGCDMDAYAATRDEVQKFFVVPEASQTKRYFQVLKNITEKYKIKYIYPTIESEIQFFDHYRDYFESQGVTIFIHDPTILDTFFDKYETIEFLKNHKIPYPKTFLIKDYRGELGYPIMMKPRWGSGSKDVIRIINVEEFHFYKKRVPNAIIQEYLEGENEEYTVGVFFDGKDVSSVAFRRLIGFGGTTKIAQLVKEEAIVQLAERVARSIGVIGTLNLQMRKTSKGYFIFEINPRFSSTVYFRHYFGFRDVQWWLNVKRNNKINYKPLNFKGGVIARVLQEKFYDFHK